MSSLVLSVFDESSSLLQVTRTIIKAWMSLNFCQTPSPFTELAAFERLKNECIMLWALLYLHFWSNLFILACNKDSKKSLDGFKNQQDRTWVYWVSCPRTSEKCCKHSNAFIFGWIFIILAGIKDNYKSLNEVDFWPHLTTNYRVSCPWVFKI